MGSVQKVWKCIMPSSVGAWWYVFLQRGFGFRGPTSRILVPFRVILLRYPYPFNFFSLQIYTDLKNGPRSWGKKLYVWKSTLIFNWNIWVTDSALTEQYTFSWKTNLSFGYSSLKSLEFLMEHSLSDRILATISFPCHEPRQIYITWTNEIIK